MVISKHSVFFVFIFPFLGFSFFQLCFSPPMNWGVIYSAEVLSYLAHFHIDTYKAPSEAKSLILSLETPGIQNAFTMIANVASLCCIVSIFITHTSTYFPFSFLLYI